MPVKSVKDAVQKVASRQSAALVLELDLTEPLAQGVPGDPVSALMQRR